MKPGRTAAVPALKPTDEASSGRFIGFIAHKAGDRWASGAGQGTGPWAICPPRDAVPLQAPIQR